jgi:hypothetical protein
VRPRAAPAARHALPTPRWWGVAQTATTVVTLWVAGTVVSWLRLAPLVRDTVWAEDGREFLGRQAAAGLWDSLFVPYTGYLQVLPRVVTALAAQLDLSLYAVVVSALCCLVVGGVTAAVYVFSGSVVRAQWARALLASITVFAPMAPTEVLGNSANLHWYLLWLAPWLLLYRPASWAAAAVAAGIGLVAGLTEIQMIVFLPLVLVAWREPKAMLVRAGVLVGVAAQVVSTLLAPREIPPTLPNTVLDEIVGYAALPILGSAHTDAGALGAWIATAGTPVVATLAVLLVALAALPIVLGRGETRILAAALLAGSFILWATAGIVNPSQRFAVFTADDWPALQPTRYAVVPSMLVLAGLVLAAATLAARRRGTPGAVMLTALVIVALTANLNVAYSERQAGPSWAGAVADARQVCATDAPGTVTVITAPWTWSVVLDCDELSR